jgi:hypothetical protein
VSSGSYRAWGRRCGHGGPPSCLIYLCATQERARRVAPRVAVLEKALCRSGFSRATRGRPEEVRGVRDMVEPSLVQSFLGCRSSLPRTRRPSSEEPNFLPLTMVSLTSTRLESRGRLFPPTEEAEDHVVEESGGVLADVEPTCGLRAGDSLLDVQAKGGGEDNLKVKLWCLRKGAPAPPFYSSTCGGCIEASCTSDGGILGVMAPTHSKPSPHLAG